MSTVSVIIPNYNHARFLKRRIESILNQTYQDFEVILLDDASTDDSHCILESYRHHPKVKQVLYNAQNLGSPFLQWQRGIEVANTEWIWIAESDDDCDASFLASLVPAFSSQDAVLAYSEIDWVDGAGNLIKKGVEGLPAWMEGEDFLRRFMLMQDHLVNAGMVVFRRSCAAHVPPNWLGMKQAGDYWFWCHIARQGLVYACGSSLAKFVRHQNSSSNKYLYTKFHYQESMQVLTALHDLGIFKNTHIKRYLLEQLVGLETCRKAISVKRFKEDSDYWLTYVREFGLSISHFAVQFKAIQRKMDHWWRTKILRKSSHAN